MYLLMLLLLLQVSEEKATHCPIITATRVTKPLYLLTLVPFFDNNNGGQDIEVLTGALIARDKINNHSDLLSGYHIELIVENTEDCSSTETAIGLTNLVKYTVSPPCHPVVAVAGLLCSSHTSVLSPVAGHDGYDLIQLSAANSPIFQTQNHRFPHLWRFLGSATVYSDTVLAIMDQYSWTRIGLVYDTQSVFYIQIVEHLVQKITASTNKTVVFSIGIRNTTVTTTILSTIQRKASETTIVMTVLDLQRAIAVQSLVQNQSSASDIFWIHLNTSQTNTQQSKDHSVQHKHFRLHECFILKLQTNTSELVKTAFNNQQSLFSLVLYDQVWALALALNKSLPELKSRNLSIDSFRQHNITAIIEEQMSNLRFQGTSGWIEFDQYRSVSTPVEILWVSNGNERLVGVYNPLQPTNFHVGVNSSNLPSDKVPLYYYIILRYLYTPLPVAILLYIFTGFVLIFTTVQLILYLRYRHHKVIKATSPCLSLLIFLGSYLLCIAAILMIMISHFIMPCKEYLILFGVTTMLVMNGFGLIFLTLLVKLIRLYQIFTNWMSKDLGKCWNNYHLLLAIIILNIIPNIAAVVPLFVWIDYFLNCTLIKYEKFAITSISIIMGLTVGFYLLSLSLVFIWGILNRKIKHKNFKNTSQIYFLSAVLVYILLVAAAFYILYYQDLQIALAESVLATEFLIVIIACQVILFLPKIARVACMTENL